MDPGLMANENFLAWMTHINSVCPDFCMGLKDMVALLPKGVVKFESFCETMTLYCGLRDWKELPCPDLEHWLRSNVLPLDPRFSKSLDQLPRPQTILDDSSVQAWFERAKFLDPSYCSELKAIILSRSLGVGTESPLPGWIWTTYYAASVVTATPCEVLNRWLKENSDQAGR